MNLIKLGLFGSLCATVISISPMTHLTQKSIQSSPLKYFDDDYTKSDKNNLAEKASYCYTDKPEGYTHEQKKDLIDKAKVVNEKIEEQEKILNSKKQYVQGLDQAIFNGLVAEVWVTKAYLGNVATILGVAGGTTVVAITIISLTLVSLGTAIAGPIGGIIGVIVAALYSGSVAVLMNEINSYKVGGYFKIDYSLVASWLTAMGTVRSQDEYESAPRLVALNEQVNFGNKRSYDMKLNDGSKGIVRYYWELDESEKYIGVMDISKYTSYSQHEHINYITGSIGMRNINNKETALRSDFELLDFLKDYYKDKDNDYLFWTLEKDDEEHLLFKLGGTQYIDGIKQHHKWIERHILSDVAISDLMIDLQIELKK